MGIDSPHRYEQPPADLGAGMAASGETGHLELAFGQRRRCLDVGDGGWGRARASGQQKRASGLRRTPGTAPCLGFVDLGGSRDGLGGEQTRAQCLEGVGECLEARRVTGGDGVGVGRRQRRERPVERQGQFG